MTEMEVYSEQISVLKYFRSEKQKLFWSGKTLRIWYTVRRYPAQRSAVILVRLEVRFVRFNADAASHEGALRSRAAAGRRGQIGLVSGGPEFKKGPAPSPFILFF